MKVALLKNFFPRLEVRRDHWSADRLQARASRCRRVHLHRGEQRRTSRVLRLPLRGHQAQGGGALQQDLRDRSGGGDTYLQGLRGPPAQDHLEEVVQHVSVHEITFSDFTF